MYAYIGKAVTVVPVVTVGELLRRRKKSEITSLFFAVMRLNTYGKDDIYRMKKERDARSFFYRLRAGSLRREDPSLRSG